MRREKRHFFLPACDSALAAADLEAALVRPSRITDEAAVAALDDVVLAGAAVCESALAAAVFDRAPVEPLCIVRDALDAALLPVTFPLAIC
jgi:hypothetical protein